MAAFTLLAAFAQLETTASRVTVLTYTMPIWAALFAYAVLGERLTWTRGNFAAALRRGIGGR